MFQVRSSNENEVTSAVQDRMPPTRGALAETRLIVIGMLFATLTDQNPCGGTMSVIAIAS